MRSFVKMDILEESRRWRIMSELWELFKTFAFFVLFLGLIGILQVYLVQSTGYTFFNEPLETYKIFTQ